VGVCSLTARIANQLNSSNHGSIQLVGYLPEHLPRGAMLDPEFSEIVRTAKTSDFSLLEPIQMWTDLLLSGIDPKDVCLFCIGGGNRSAAELALAWGLGARAAVLNDGSVAAQRFGNILEWAGAETASGILLPEDTATLIAFFAFDSPIDSKQWETSGQSVHESYLKSQQKNAKQPNLLPWRLLRDDFKFSNIHQAACSANILRRCGFIVEPTRLPIQDIPLIEFTAAEIELLAEWEHGRWNVERVNSGWRYEEKKDEARKLHPCLVPWKVLPESMKKFDRDAVCEWPAILSRASWVVHRK
jgi:hypothetical protein